MGKAYGGGPHGCAVGGDMNKETGTKQGKSLKDDMLGKRFTYINVEELAEKLHTESVFFCFDAEGKILPPFDVVKDRVCKDGKNYGEHMREHAKQIIQFFEYMEHFKAIGVLDAHQENWNNARNAENSR